MTKICHNAQKWYKAHPVWWRESATNNEGDLKPTLFCEVYLVWWQESAIMPKRDVKLTLLGGKKFAIFVNSDIKPALFGGESLMNKNLPSDSTIMLKST